MDAKLKRKILTELEARAARVSADESMNVFTTRLEVLAFVAEVARGGKLPINEADAVELVLLSNGADSDELKQLAKDMKRLGYHAVSQRLALMARRPRFKAKPRSAGRWLNRLSPLHQQVVRDAK